jgi:hypothetical protein
MLQLTPLLFATNAAHALTKRHLFYAILLLFLTGTSVAWHSAEKLKTESMKLFWLDQIAIWAFIVMSLFYATRLSYAYLIPVLVLAAIMAGLVYYLGVVCGWDKSYPGPHAALHTATSVLGHVILFGLV